MHIEISEHNAIYKRFNDMRIDEGFTTFKAGIISAMKLFISNYEHIEEIQHEN